MECFDCGREIDPYEEPISTYVEGEDRTVKYICTECVEERTKEE